MTGLPGDAFIWVLREDGKNPNVLYLGTEVGAFVSFDAGGLWSRFNLKNLPTVAVQGHLPAARTERHSACDAWARPLGP